MKKIIFVAIFSLFSIQVNAADLFCEAWYQDVGQALQKQRLEIQSETVNNLVFAGSFHGYDFKVDWNRELSTFYTFIESAGKRILFTTARVPTEDHPESFTDLEIPSGPRLSISCELL